jgi:DHA3 family macrolide efflux protein-like MFS transporter
MKPFLVLWTGQAVSLLGSHLVQFAIVWWLARNSGSATLLALATLAALLPQILIAPFAGALVDRWSRRTILIAADSAVALATLALAVLFWLNLAPMWAIYALLAVRAAGAAFHWPAMQASTTLMVPEKHLARVGGLNQALGGLAGIFIPPLGALAVEVLPIQGVLAIDVATALPAIAALLFIAIPQPRRAALPEADAHKPSMLMDMREGLRFIWGWKAVLLFALIGVMVNMLGQAAGSLMPLIVLKHFGRGALELGWFQSAAGVGAISGGLLLSAWGGFRRRVVPSMLALALDGLAILLVGLSPKEAFLFAVVMIFATGFLETIVLGLNGAIGQAIIPPEMQGRVFSLIFSVSQALAPLGLLVAGPTADALGVGFWWMITGILIFVMGGGALFVPEIVHIEDAREKTAKVIRNTQAAGLQ